MIKKGVIFDLDGTLWNTVTQIVPAWNRVFEKYDTCCKLTESTAIALMGKTAPEIAATLMPELPETEREKILYECCLEEYKVLRKIGGTLYPQLYEVLTQLKEKYFLGIVSNCLDGYIQTFLEYNRFGDLFDDTECAGCTGKSKGENIRLMINRNGLDKVIYVGDTQGDFAASRFAEIPFVHASYGFGAVEDAEYRIARFSDIEALSAKLLD